MSRRIRAGAGVALILALLLVEAPASVLAATPTTTTLVSVGSPAYYLQYATYEATVSPAPGSGIVYFEASYDGGATWPQIVATSGTFADEFTSASAYPTDSDPAGARLIRARFLPLPGSDLEASTSANTIEQVVAKRPTSINDFQVWDANHGTNLVPDSSPLTLYATLTGISDGPDVVFEDQVDGSWVPLASSGILWAGGPDHFATTTIGGLSEGTHHLRARWPGTTIAEAATATLDVAVEKGHLTTVFDLPSTVQAHHTFPVAAWVDGGSYGVPITGTVSVKESSTVLGSVAAPGGTITIPALSIGTHALTLTYDGDDNYLPATAGPVTVTVTADQVEASGVGLEFATFYPYIDGYRDTVKIKGTRLEPLSVTARVYSPTGSLVKTLTASRASGAYALTWTGRNSAGTILAAGQYKVVQTLTDAFGTTKSFTAYVNLSTKQLVTYTTSVSKKGSSITAKGHGGSGSVTVNTTSGYTKLYAGSGYAIAGWELTLPSATVYKSISFRVDAKVALAVPSPEIAMQNFKTCARSSTWYDSCFDHWKSIGNASGSLQWYSTSGSASNNRSGRYVRGLVSTTYKTVYVYSVQVRVTYQVLK